ncbi:MAG: BamA/TamA family outer membrane protein [Pelomonas sp.]|nr:BamA/TamA family outer membrane protein [Roseateles sp.]
MKRRAGALIPALALLLLLFALPLRAATSAPSLKIDGPTALADLLGAHLELARTLREDEVSELSSDELARLAAAAPAQARDLLQTEGYFDPTLRLDGDAASGGWTLHVAPGPRALVAEATLYFDGDLGAPAQAAAAAQLRRAWTQPPGRPFTQTDWDAAKTDLLTRVRAAGWPLARWTSTVARVETARQAVHLSLLLDSGPRARLGALQIVGLHLQSEQSVERLAGFAPGTPYTQALLDDFQDRLRRTQLFDSVSVALAPELDAAHADAAPVIVRLREAPRRQTTVGVGFHANTGQSASLELLDRQPFGLPLTARNKLQFGRELRAGSLELSSYPQADMSRNLASLQAEQDRSGAEVLDTLSARVGRVHEQGHDERLVYAEWLHSLQTDANGRSSSDAVSFNVQWKRSRVDNALLPTEGTQALLLLGGGRAEASNAASGLFGRARLLLQAYRPIGGWYGSTRLELAEVFAASNIGVPQKLLWRAGGDDSVRGYAYQALGPTVNGLAVGGRVMATGTVELAHPLFASMPSLWGAGFVDAGQAAQRWQDWRPDWGVGGGVRWRSPVGPLRVDIARGVEVHHWRLHFSVGVNW